MNERPVSILLGFDSFFLNFYVFISVCAGSSLPLHRLSLVVARRGYSLVVGHELLVSVASLLTEHGL